MPQYLTFPIALFRESNCIRDVIDYVFEYCLYEHCYSEGIDIDDLEEGEEYLGITFSDIKRSYKIGKMLFDSISHDAPRTSIRKEILFNFYKNEKSEFEIDCFLAFAAVRSIIQKDACKKITNAYLLSRMSGHAKKCDQFHPRLKKYRTRYQIDKLKTELQINWGLKLYGRFTRGAYMSFKMELPDLIRFVEKRRNSNKVKLLAKQKKDIRQSVMIDLNYSQKRA